jgi:hypothetical protein
VAVRTTVRTTKFNQFPGHLGGASAATSYRERTIGLSARAIEILRGLSPRLAGAVFDNRADSVSRNFRAACERAGIKPELDSKRQVAAIRG